MAGIFALSAAGPARADTYCVSDPACVTAGGHDEGAALQDALDAALANGGDDTVQLGAGNFTAATTNGFVYSTADASNTVQLKGAGSSLTTLSGQDAVSNTTQSLVLNLDVPAPGSNIADLAVVVPGHTGMCCTTSTGIVARNADIDRIDVSAQPSITGGTGVLFGGHLRNSTITMPNLGGTPAARPVDGSTSTVEDCTLSGYYGVYLDSQAAQTTATVTRTRINAYRAGIYAQGSVVTVEDTLIQANSDHGATVSTKPSLDATMTLRNDTILGANWGAEALAPDNTQTATLTVDSSIIDQPGVNTIKRTGSPGTADALVRFSNWPTGTNAESGTGTLTESTGNTHVTDAGFVNSGTGDYRLHFDSPLIDAGNPLPFVDESATDLAGLNRIVDGDGDLAAVRDMGAFEYQRSAPVPSATVSPASVGIGAPATFDGSGSHDPDPETLTYAWSFDDGGAATGAVVAHAFATAGSHKGTLTVTDPVGRHASAAATVTVTAPPSTPAPVQPGGPTARFAGVKLRKGRIRVTGASARVPITCPATAIQSCKGTITLTASAGAAARKRLKLGKATFTVSSGKTRTISVKLSKRALARLKTHGTLKALLAVVAKDGAGSAKNTSAQVTLARAKKRGKH